MAVSPSQTLARRKAAFSRACLTVIDVLHFFVLEGEELERDAVIRWLHRVTSARASSERSQLRAYDRLKTQLRALGVAFETRGDPRDATSIFIPRPAEAKARIEALLDEHACRQVA